MGFVRVVAALVVPRHMNASAHAVQSALDSRGRSKHRGRAAAHPALSCRRAHEQHQAGRASQHPWRTAPTCPVDSCGFKL